MSCLKTNPPKIGVVANSIKVFSDKGKEAVEAQMKSFFEAMKKEGFISGDSIFYEHRIFAQQEAEKPLDLFVRQKIDALVILNSAFPDGNTFLTFAANPYLWRIPLIVTAPAEIDLGTQEWTTNAYCGLIMNNFTAKKLGRHVFTLAGWPEQQDYQDKFKQLMSVVYTIRELRSQVVGKFGEAPGGFHPTSGNVLDYAKVFGARFETVAISKVIETYHSGKAEGLKATVTFEPKQVEQTFKKMTASAEIATAEDDIEKAARLYHALKALIEANGFGAISFRCWPEIMESLGMAPCFSLGWLLSEGVVHSAACEGDWPNAISQSIGGLLSNKPCACLDFVNKIGDKSIVQLAHCGVGIPRLMADAKLSQISPDRQAGNLTSPACVGQFAYGVKTGICLTQDETGRFKMLVFTGENRPDTAQNIRYCAADIEVRNYQKLDRLIIQNGFGHHLAMAFGDISSELELLCDFYDIEYISPDKYINTI